MTDAFTVLPDAACKDAHPADTVRHIKTILSSHGIETEEFWGESNVPHCYSLRINIAGTTIGSNGKGVTRELALASGYGELMERLQLGLIWRNKLQIEGGASSCEAQSQPVKAAQLLARNRSWYTAYAQTVAQTVGVSMTEAQLLQQYTDAQGMVQATPYYCLRTGTQEYLPTALCKTVYATSGGAAGNTMEEAMVQALSEIVERHYKLRVISENIAIPEIPEENLRQWPIAWQIIEYLRSNGFRISVKDCSLGTKFPVVCICIVDTATGKYHTHFGAYPDFEIALQRTLTESFQGRNVRTIARHEDFSDPSPKNFDMRFLMYELVKGTSEKTPDFFIKQPAEPYRPTAGFTGKTNRERLKECIDFFHEQGYDILVRDSSTLGFPTCQIIIPGYSEVLPQRMCSKYNDSRYSLYSSRALRNPVVASMEDRLGLMLHIAQSGQLRMYGMESFTTESGIPANLSADEESYLMNTAMAHINYSLGKIKESVGFIGKALRSNAATDKEYLLCLKRYLSLKLQEYSAEDIQTTLRYFHQPQTVERLYTCLEKKENPLNSVVLCCDLQCRADCRLFSHCKKKLSDQIVHLIVAKAKELDQAALAQYLQEL